MRDFDKQLKAYGDKMRNARCPYSEAEMDREIRRAVWDDRRGVATGATDATTKPQKHRLWPSVAAAACLLALLIPLGLHTKAKATISRVDVDGEQIYFACNNACSPDATIETFKTLLR